MTITNPKLKRIAERASNDLLHFISESEEKLLAAWHAAEEEAQLNDVKPKFKFGLAITLDLDADNMSTALTFGSKHKFSRDGSIPNPDDVELPFEADKAARATAALTTTFTIDAKAASMLKRAAVELEKEN